MELREAIELSIVKWEYVVKNGGSYFVSNIIGDVPEIAMLPSNCGLCSMYKADGCVGCPLNDKQSLVCAVEFQAWCNAQPAHRLYWAKKLLQRLKNELMELDR